MMPLAMNGMMSHILPKCNRRFYILIYREILFLGDDME